MRRKQQQVKTQRGLFERSLASLPLVKKFFPGAPKSLENVALLVDLFATFASLDEKIELSETNVILDLLRHAYPEADHGWLSRRLSRAFKDTLSLQSQARLLKGNFTEEERSSISLQLFLLVESSTKKSKGRSSFLDLLEMINLKHVGEFLANEFNQFASATKIEFIETLTIGDKSADITLERHDSPAKCKLFKAGNTIVLQNAGDSTLQLAGNPLHKGGCTRLRRHQSLQLLQLAFSYADLEFFFDAKYRDSSRSLFLGEDDGILTIDRSKSRSSFARIDFKLDVNLTVLKDSSLRIPGIDAIQKDKDYTLSNQSSIIPQAGNPLTINQLRLQALDSGGRFKLQKQKQTCIISNISENIGDGDLQLTEGLADPVTLSITFDREKGTGLLDVLEKGSSNILVNDVTVTRATPIKDGSLIRVGPNQAIRCRFNEGLLEEERTTIQQLRIEGLSHQFRGNTVLDNIDFSLHRGEMLCVMGPSGSGKSTLLSALAGQLRPTRGHVRLNEISLYHYHDRLANFIAYMPQEEALSAQLTVREHLLYSIKIRQPSLNSNETQKRIDTILDELSLQPLSNRKVGSADDKSLSGGERSRLNLGLDLGSQAEVFLFDEPISGLSSKDSEHVTESLKSISRDKIVIASLHRPGEKILARFDKVLLIDNGGRVAFFGTPDAMRNYYKLAARELQIQTANHEGQNSADFVFDVLEAPLVDIVNTQNFENTRRFPPLFWQERFESHTLYQNVKSGDTPAHTTFGDLPRSDDNMPIPKQPARKPSEYLRLFKAHFWRATLSKYRSMGTVWTTLLEVPLLALVIAWTLRASADGQYEFHTGLHIVTYLFLSLTVGMFLGLTNSATEILRDRPTLRRERNCRYSNFLFLLAKFISLSILAAVQCAIYLLIGNSMLEIPGMWLNHWMWMTAIAMSGTSIALFISSSVKTERAALSAVPLVLVPQLLLAGTPLIPFEEMNRGLFSGAQESRKEGKEPVLSRIIPLRYAYEGITVDQATNNLFEKTRRSINDRAQALKDKKSFNMTYLNEGLSEIDSERLNVLLRALTKLYSIQATTEAEAKELILRIESRAITGSEKDIKSIKSKGDEKKLQPCHLFFVNQRAEQLVQKQDIQRVDLTKEQNRNIFLAEKKYFGQEDNPKYKELVAQLNSTQITKLNKDLVPSKKIPRSWSTSKLCFAIILSLSVFLLLLSTFIVARSNKRTTE